MSFSLSLKPFVSVLHEDAEGLCRIGAFTQANADETPFMNMNCQSNFHLEVGLRE
jgi:hypothetical protein